MRTKLNTRYFESFFNVQNKRAYRIIPEQIDELIHIDGYKQQIHNDHDFISFDSFIDYVDDCYIN